jgi:hypothetical protein
MMTQSPGLRSRFPYDFPTAVTFLIFGAGLGWLLAMIRPPRLQHAEVEPLAVRPRAS